MKLKELVGMLIVVGALPPGVASGADYGTAAEARAMLEKAVAEIEKEQAAALAKFNKGEGGFKDRDLYVFCAGPDGITTAHPREVGNNLKKLKDITASRSARKCTKSQRKGKLRK